MPAAGPVSAAATGGSINDATHPANPPVHISTTQGARLSDHPDGVGFDLFVHCGIKYLTYRNHTYKALRSADPPVRLATPGTSVATETGYVHGHLRVVNAKTVTFTVDDPTVSINGRLVEFRITNDVTPPCS